MKRLTIHSAAALLKGAAHVLVIGHSQPDGDCLGSMTALALGLEALGKAVTVWADEPVPIKYRFIAGNIQRPDPAAAHGIDLIAVVDTPSLARIGINRELLPAGVATLSFDHHPIGREEFTYAVNDPAQAAAGCMVFDLLRELGVPITRNIANALYAAIITDTGSFTYATVNRRVFEIVLELIDAGVVAHDIARMIYGSGSVTQMRLLGAALNTLELVHSGKGALMHLSREMQNAEHCTQPDTENFVNFARAILGVEVAAMVTEMPDDVLRLSLRAKKPGVDVSLLAQEFGGGGHPGAAGAIVHEPFSAFMPKLRVHLNAFLERLHAHTAAKHPHGSDHP